MKTVLMISLLLLLFQNDAQAGRIVEGLVREVYDGDTLLLVTREESRFKVRMYGIDSPETTKPDMPGQAFGAAARRTLMYKIMGRLVQAEVIDIDQYKRAVVIIRYAGRDINQEMVKEGMAWAYRRYLESPYTSQYINMENLAKSRRIGLWREANPLPPWDFRKSLYKHKTNNVN